MKPKLVALRAIGLGDLLTATPALRAVGRAFSDHHRILATTAPMLPLAKLIGGFDEYVAVEPLADLPEECASADIGVNLHGSGPESHNVLKRAGAIHLLAFASGEAEVVGPPWQAQEHEVDRWCRMLRYFGVSAEPSDLDLYLPSTPLMDAYRDVTVVHPGAAFASRRWPVERWAAVVKSEVRAGRRVVLTGSTDEVELCEALALAADVECENLVGRTSIVELAEVIAAASRVLCADTGVAHVATAVRTPSVVLFGPAPPALWGPPAGREIHRVLWAGRKGDPRGSVLDPGLASITVDDVIAASRELPAPPAEVIEPVTSIANIAPFVGEAELAG